MGKILDTSSSSTTNGFPPTQGTWDFLQMAHMENVADTIIGMIGSSYSTTKLYRLWGVKQTLSILTLSYTSGALFYNGEIYRTDAASFVIDPGVDDAQSFISTTHYTTNADPVQFSDPLTSPINIHNIRKIVFTNQSSTGGVYVPIANGGLSLLIGSAATNPVDIQSITPFVPSYTTINGSGAGFTSTLKYAKNPMTNLLYINGSATVTTSAAAPSQFSSIGTLPAGFIPAVNSPFSLYYRYHLSTLLDSTSFDYIRQINGQIDSGTGNVGVGFIRSTSSYDLIFNCVIPLL